MKIAHLVTACAALITALYRVETVHSERKPQPKVQSLERRAENTTDVSDITFTTLQPEVASSSTNARSNLYLGSSKRLAKVRPNRSMSSRGPNAMMEGGRRRRQLQRLAKASTKASGTAAKVGRSYDIGANKLDTHQIEAVQPAEAFDDGAIHIEPIYRVTKNKGILDSLLGILRRVVSPPQLVGPLVGPFHFPGVGDKVYVRLLEPDQPKHLSIRLVTHLPASETEATFDKNILPPTDLLSHSEIPSIGHEALSLSAGSLGSIASTHHGNVQPSFVSSDSLLSPSDNLAQIAKQPFVSTSHNGDLTNVQRVVRHHKIERPMSAPKEGRLASGPYPKFVEPKNNSQDTYYLRANSLPGPREHSHRLHTTVNDSWNERPLGVNTREPFKPFQLQVEGSSTPRYSIDFVSKNMRYLNMDGGVEAASDTLHKNGGFKPMEQSPAPQKVSRSVSQHWEPVKKGHSETKGVGKQLAGVNAGQKGTVTETR
ncbi:uncharacterized protein LOC143369581 isoform X2 [Andrena cerasifolii]|uniref:uncharacterized protein LOC143369581 isoform X2 n=1 Tax=Andrena cerasifolii TaxID=2819439 RepID=UPI0040383E82